MDTISASAVARELDTSVPRVTRAIERLGMPVRRGGGGRVRLTKTQAARLRTALGVTPVLPGLSRTEVQVLGALARSALGVVSIRGLARRAGVSPTATERAVQSLSAKGLVLRERQMVAAGRAQKVEVIRANVTSPRWPELASQLNQVVVPPARRRRDRRVPARLRHIFWNTAPEQLDVGAHGDYIARRLLISGDIDALAWGAENLAPEHWDHAARTRGADPDRRALARNLARRVTK